MKKILLSSSIGFVLLLFASCTSKVPSAGSSINEQTATTTRRIEGSHTTQQNSTNISQKQRTVDVSLDEVILAFEKNIQKPK